MVVIKANVTLRLVKDFKCWWLIQFHGSNQTKCYTEISQNLFKKIIKFFSEKHLRDHKNSSFCCDKHTLELLASSNKEISKPFRRHLRKVLRRSFRGRNDTANKFGRYHNSAQSCYGNVNSFMTEVLII